MLGFEGVFSENLFFFKKKKLISHLELTDSAGLSVLTFRKRPKNTTKGPKKCPKKWELTVF